MATPTVYVICDQNCKFEGMTKEQILSAILQAVNEGTISDIDAGFITSVKTINGQTLRFFMGEQAAYDALSEEQKAGLFAIITNDTTKEGVLAAIEDLKANNSALSKAIEDIIAGKTEVGKADYADKANYVQTYNESANVELPIVAAEKTNGQARRMVLTGMTYNPSTDTLKVGNIDGYMKETDGVQVLSRGAPKTTQFNEHIRITEMPSGKSLGDIMFVTVYDHAANALLIGGVYNGEAHVCGVGGVTRTGRTEYGMALNFGVDEEDDVLFVSVNYLYSLTSGGTYDFREEQIEATIGRTIWVDVYFK